MKYVITAVGKNRGNSPHNIYPGLPILVKPIIERVIQCPSIKRMQSYTSCLFPVPFVSKAEPL